ncbi:hypothetical protein A2V49_04405 [candidate division WWE3 bacterium RBG_19FT_COMBO_34_6]|uniref:Baseplate protein J-like domain-containing protein n=1 Tax=candidate division WWE3 bacterium RBG_19FT_COMBO_34_6 TaxID=1802612 RepID=A0A1F4UPS7_UNCKA|nr:MAG: hypothetical protein A2V49_04405 [candidate division WWE3 bacterium RBG_19FT_COMBO_34_6]
MTKIEIAIHENVVSVINKLKNCEDSVIDLYVPENAVIFESNLNLKLIRFWSDSLNKVINFNTDDENGQSMLLSLEEKPETINYDDQETEVSLLEENAVTKKMKLPKFKLFSIKKNKAVIFGVLVSGVLLLLFFLLKHYVNMPKADIKIIVNSEPLTRSVQIKVKNGESSSSEKKLLKGITVEAIFEDKITMQTTGEKIIGEKAKGKVIISNKTADDKLFKKGTTLIYDEDDKEYEYVTLKEVEVPARTEVPDLDPETPADVIITWGESDPVEVEAKLIGKKYNLEKDKNLDIKDQKSSEFEAEVKEEIKGGKEETVKVVSQKDIDTIKLTLLENSQENALRALTAAVTGNQKLINGSTKTAVLKETFSNKLDDETDDLTLTQSFIIKGLTYEPKDLNELIDILVKDYVKEGYVLSDRERTINVEVLGNTETAVLSETEADIQVTLKTYIITDISEEKLKSELMGKKVSEAQKIIGGIKNIKTYEIHLNPNIPFMNFVPKDASRINLVIERE